ncbi:MAG TPA: aldehyde dehydrogenase family protein, partial [Xanthobacteraceae bacterium]
MESLKRMEDRYGEADTANVMAGIGRAARAAAHALSLASTETKNHALRHAAATIRARAPDILAANARDVASAKASGTTAAFLDRLALDSSRVEAMASGLDAIAALPDPVGRVLARFERPNGLSIERVATPLGVIGVIYESRPAVTADAGALCLKAGNAVILRGGSESFFSARCIHECLVAGLSDAGLSSDAITLVPIKDRAAVGEMLAGLNGNLDVIV